MTGAHRVSITNRPKGRYRGNGSTRTRIPGVVSGPPVFGSLLSLRPGDPVPAETAKCLIHNRDYHCPRADGIGGYGGFGRTRRNRIPHLTGRAQIRR